MRTLSAGLLAAQRGSSAVPYLKVTISDRIGGIRRLAFSRLYSGSEPDSYHVAAIPGDGSLLRSRVAGGRLYYQRVANPGPSILQFLFSRAGLESSSAGSSAAAANQYPAF